jgi:hypothetical protein
LVPDNFEPEIEGQGTVAAQITHTAIGRTFDVFSHFSKLGDLNQPGACTCQLSFVLAEF